MTSQPEQVNGQPGVASIRMFTLAHLSDVHLAPLPEVTPNRLFNKRFFGYQSWYRRRAYVHFRDVADAMRDDIRQIGPDHVAITGDLVNISLEEEFAQAADWLREFGSPEWISVIPGNHDAYIPMNWNAGMGLWSPYMTGDADAGHSRDHAPDHSDTTRFPYLRRRGDIAIIGLSTAVPTPPTIARGWLGRDQITALSEMLEHLAGEDLFTVILIHHPPLPGQNQWRKAMADTREFVEVVGRHGADLILHGHNHRQMQAHIERQDRRIPVFGVASASARRTVRRPAAHYNLYAIERIADAWTCTVTVRAWQESESSFATVDTFRA